MQLQKRISTNLNQSWLNKWLETNETDFKEDSHVQIEANAHLSHHLITPSFLKHTIVIVSLIVGTFLFLILLIALIVVSLFDYLKTSKNNCLFICIYLRLAR